MVIVTTASGYSYKYYPNAKQHIKAHTLATVDGGVTINTGDNLVDNAHLLLTGNLPVSDYYIRCKSGNTNLMTVDGDGDIKCKDLTCDDIEADAITLPQVQDLETYLAGQSSVILANQSVVTNATRLKGAETLVKRGQSSGTEIEYVKANQVHALAPNSNMSVYGDGTFNWVPQNTSGVDRPNVH